MDTLRLINSLGSSNKRKLLKTFNHKNINEAIKHYTDVKKRKYTETEKLNAYQLMQDEYNNIVEIFRQDEPERKKQQKQKDAIDAKLNIIEK